MKSPDFIPLSEPCLKGKEWQNVKQCLDTGWVSSVGRFVEGFEKAVADYSGRKYAVACASGTAALHTALMLAGVGEGDEVIMPALTFAAPAFATRYTGAWPVFMDVDPRFWQLDVQKTADFLLQACKKSGGKLINRTTGRRVKAIVPVHLLGACVDMQPLMDLARRYGLVVIEDVAESIGAEYHGKKAGSLGDMACFSFNGNKIITCGGGGMLVTNDEKLAHRARHLTTQAKTHGVEYIHDAVGYNYRLTNVQAAIGLAQMDLLGGFIKKKGVIAANYARKLKTVAGIELPQTAPETKSIFWLYTILIDPKKYGMDSRQLMQALAKESIQSRPLWHPLPTQKIFKASGRFQITEAARIYKHALSLPSSPSLKPVQQARVIDLICQLRRT